MPNLALYATLFPSFQDMPSECRVSVSCCTTYENKYDVDVHAVGLWIPPRKGASRKRAEILARDWYGLASDKSQQKTRTGEH